MDHLTSSKCSAGLTSTDNGVLQRGAVLEDENRIGITTLLLASALDAAAVGLVASVKGSADRLGLLVGDRTLGLGNRERSTLGQAEELVGSLLGRSGSDGSHEGSGGSNDGELHFENLSTYKHLGRTMKVYSRIEIDKREWVASSKRETEVG